MPPRRSKPLVVGMTGGIGSGKTTAAQYFATRLPPSRQPTVVDADQVARAVVAPGQPALTTIVDRYGAQLLLADGGLDRQQLRTILFSAAGEKRWLENLLHPLIQARVIAQLSAANSPYVILVSPLLLETQQRHWVDRMMVIDVPVTMQLQRAMQRDRMDEQQARRIIASQCSRAERLQNADEVVNNSGTVAQLYQRLAPYHRLYLGLAEDLSQDD